MISVTTALNPWTDFSMIRPEVLAYAAARGTAVHEACAAYALCLFVPELPDDHQGFFMSFKLWFDRYVSEVYFVEKEFIDEALGFYGHADLGCRLKDGRVMVVDIKTPAAASKTWGPQLAAYLHLAGLPAYRAIKWDGCMSLQPKKDGGKAKATIYKNSDQDFAIFLSSLNCYRYFKGDTQDG